jgi:hypothetical protein
VRHARPLWVHVRQREAADRPPAGQLHACREHDPPVERGRELSAGGANEAIRELDEAVDTCPHTPVGSKVQGLGPLTYRITRLKDARLLNAYVDLRIQITGTAAGKHISGTTVAVYQDRRNILSGVYTDLGPNGTAAAQVRAGLHGAEGAARNLRQFVR